MSLIKGSVLCTPPQAATTPISHHALCKITWQWDLCIKPPHCVYRVTEQLNFCYYSPILRNNPLFKITFLIIWGGPDSSITAEITNDSVIDLNRKLMILLNHHMSQNHVVLTLIFNAMAVEKLFLSSYTLSLVTFLF